MLRRIRPARCTVVGSVQPTLVSAEKFQALLGELKSSNEVSFDDFVAINSQCRAYIPTMTSTQLVTTLETLASIRSRERSLGLVGEIFRTLMESTRVDDLSPTDCIRLVLMCGKMRVFDSEVFGLMEHRLSLHSIDDLVALVRSLDRINEYRFFRKNISTFVACNALAVLHANLNRVIVPLMRYAVASSALDIIPICVESFHQKVEAIRLDKELLVSRSTVSSADVYSIVTLLGQLSRQCELEGRSYILPELAAQDILFCCKSIVSYELRNWDLERLLRFFFATSQLNVFDDFFVRRRLVPAIAYTLTAKADKTDKDKELIKVMLKQLPFRNQMIEDLEKLVSDSG